MPANESSLRRLDYFDKFNIHRHLILKRDQCSEWRICVPLDGRYFKAIKRIGSSS
jgi:hypothetical protein